MRWFHDGKYLPKNAKLMGNFNEILEISHFNKPNEGYYECKSKNINGYTVYAETLLNFMGIQTCLITNYNNCP